MAWEPLTTNCRFIATVPPTFGKIWHIMAKSSISIYFGSTVITNPWPFFLSPTGLLSHNPQRQCPALLARLPHSMPHFPGTEKHQTTTPWSHIREDLVLRGRGGFLRHTLMQKNGVGSLIKTLPKRSDHSKSEINEIKINKTTFSGLSP